MFTIEIVIAILKNVVRLMWKYKYAVIFVLVVALLYLRGNGYKSDYQKEVEAHSKSTLSYEKQLSDIKLANEQALRIAQEESAANYKELVEKTQTIQEKYNERNKDINATITKLNSSNNSLQQTISDYTKRNPNTSESNLRDTTYASSLQLTGELLAECVERKQYYGTEASKLQNSVTTLQEWGNMVIEANKGGKDVK